MIEHRFTLSEVEAYYILSLSGKMNTSTSDVCPFNKAGDIIIVLAERIKAERLTAAMNR